RFYRGDKARSDAKSSGLGLAIVKRILELHGGEVSASLEGEELSVHLFLG
ncbi:MAG: sensor histidine kinase, partial [Lachnospiraceae bacterium]|nr:sensor histidine kinase [Lachnospiraceae bacterium]